MYRSSELDPCGALFRLQPRVKRIFKDILRGWLVFTGVIDITHAPYGVQIPGWDLRSTAFQLVYKPSALRSFLLSSPFSSPVIINRPCYRIRADRASLIVKDRSIPWLSQRGDYSIIIRSHYIRAIKIVPLNSSEYRHGKKRDVY